VYLYNPGNSAQTTPRHTRRQMQTATTQPNYAISTLARQADHQPTYTIPSRPNWTRLLAMSITIFIQVELGSKCSTQVESVSAAETTGRPW